MPHLPEKLFVDEEPMNRCFAVIACSLAAVAVNGTDSQATGDLSAQAGHRKENEDSQPRSRSVREIEGWKVRVDDRLLGDSPQAATGWRALRFLEARLFEIKAVVPAERVADLQRVTIVMDSACGELSSMQYHPDAGWLKAHGFPAELAKCVHIPRAADLATRRNINEQPWAVLHELAHAFHDQQLGFDEPKIKGAYEKFKASGHGDAALLYDGKRVKHYGLTNQMEFFAEMTESYFGVNDFFPFNRAELKEAEPEIFMLFAEVWGARGR